MQGPITLFYDSANANQLLAFVVSLLLATFFPVRGQKEFVDSVSREEARVLCEEYIEALDVGNLVSCAMQEDHSDPYSIRGMKDAITEERSV